MSWVELSYLASEPTQTRPTYSKARCERDTPPELDLSSKSLKTGGCTNLDGPAVDLEKEFVSGVCPKALGGESRGPGVGRRSIEK
jgi:hypothetical protein